MENFQKGKLAKDKSQRKKNIEWKLLICITTYIINWTEKEERGTTLDKEK